VYVEATFDDEVCGMITSLSNGYYASFFCFTIAADGNSASVNYFNYDVRCGGCNLARQPL